MRTDYVKTEQPPAQPNSSDSSVIPVASGEQGYPRGVGLAGVANCRDFGDLPIEGTTRIIKKRSIFRMAAPTYATEDDKCLLLDKFDVITLIDFRTSYETKNLNFGRRKFEDNFMGFSVRKDGSGDIDKIDRGKEQLIMECETDYSALKRLYKGTPRVGARRHSSSGVIRKRYNIPLINDIFFFEGVYPSAPPAIKLRCNTMRHLSDKAATYFLLRHLNELGLFEMYHLTMQHCQREVLTVFKLLGRIDNHPVAFFCSLGKDRTGMISALILSCLGVNRELILDDFCETETHLEPSMPEIAAYFQKIGLCKDEFIRAPRPIMKRLLEWMDSVYGSPKAYLNAIGFTYEEQQIFYDFMTVERPFPAGSLKE